MLDKIKKIVDNGYFKVVTWCALLALASFLPEIIMDEGMLTLMADYNFQEIVFNIASSEAVKSGDIFWSWSADLGSNLIGAYSFYTLGSPFFWITLLFPSDIIPYAMGYIYMMKYIVAGVTAYAYLRLFVKEDKYAILGGVLYAFSGFSTAALMFYHFHDVVAFFPLMLMGLEKMISEKKKGLFAAGVAINALVNYVFFVGEVIFVIIYFVVKYLLSDIKYYVKKIPACIAEGALGVGMSALLFVPSVIFVLGNPRASTGIDLSSALRYGQNERYFQLVKAFLMPADPMPLETALMTTDHTTCDAWLPMFGICLAMVFCIKHRKHWLSRMIMICLVIMSVPLLNSMFYLFNSSYYARWFYMPILLVVLATIKILEEADYRWIQGGAAAGFLGTAFFGIYVYLRCRINYKYMYLGYLAIALMGCVAVFMIKYIGWRKMTWMVSVFVVVSISANLYQMRKSNQNYNYVNGLILETPKKFDFSDTEDFRMWYYWSYWNGHLVEGYPTTASFTSTVSGGIFEFYQLFGIERKFVTEFPEEYVGIPALLSTKYYVTREDVGGNIVQLFNNGYCDIYVNEMDTFIPMGFAYDYYITKDDLLNMPVEDRHYILLKALVVESEDVDRVESYLRPISKDMLSEIGEEYFYEDVESRKNSATEDFERTTRTFFSNIYREQPGYVFYSVPYESGWSAKVNGKDVEIIKAAGFMAVPVESGESNIEFSYMTPGLVPGVVISLLSWGIWGILIFHEQRMKRKALFL